MYPSTFEKRILTQLLELKQRASKAPLGTEIVELDQTKMGRLSRIDAMQVQQMSLESERRQQRQRLALEAALKRIQNDIFGYCCQCEEKINPERLEIDLTITLCIVCANRREMKQNAF